MNICVRLLVSLPLVALAVAGPAAELGVAERAPTTITREAVAAPGTPKAATWRGTLRAAVKSLERAPERRRGYERDLFRHWIDRDSDGCDTRDEVLIAEARTGPAIGSGCALSQGSWTSYYDARSTTDPSSLDVDHMVPLAEAWDSGARAWTAATRQRFANDLGDSRALVAVTASANRSKGDRDPAEWMPDKRRCLYVRQYVATKLRWSLEVDGAEKRFLRARAASCPDVSFSVTKVSIGRR